MWNLEFLYSKSAPTPTDTEVLIQKTENRPSYGDFGFLQPKSPTSPNFKTTKIFALHTSIYKGSKVHTLAIIYTVPFILNTPLRNLDFFAKQGGV